MLTALNVIWGHSRSPQSAKIKSCEAYFRWALFFPTVSLKMHVDFGACVDSPLKAYVTVSRPQKYLIFGEATRDDFLRCGGNYSSDRFSGLLITLKLIPFRPGATVVTFSANDPKYVFNCTPPMPSGNNYVSVSSAFCTLGIKSAKLEDQGTYVCEVKSSNSSILAQSANVTLVLYGELLKCYTFLSFEICNADNFILNTSIAQNSQQLFVNEFDRVNLSCPVNLQGDLGDLNIEWRKFDVVLRAAKANRVHDAFHYVIPSANRNDAGMYKCVVVSTIYGNMTVDSLQKILHVNCKCHSSTYAFLLNFLCVVGPVVRIVSSPSPVINHSTVAVDQYKNNYINCSAEGYPSPDVVLSHNDKQINDTDGNLKIVSATERDAGTYCCNASNALGRSNETCLTLGINCKYKVSITLFCKLFV